MNKIYTKIQNYIARDFDMLEIDNFLNRGCDVYSFIISYCHDYNLKNQDDKFTDSDLVDLFQDKRHIDFICQSLTERFTLAFDVNFPNKIYQILFDGKAFPYRNLGDMSLNINKFAVNRSRNKY